MTTDDYGRCVITRDDNDRLIVTRADRTIGITTELLTAAAGEDLTTDADGRLVIVGQVRYTPVRFAADGRIVVCVRAD